MLRTGLVVALLLSCLSVPARADDQPSAPAPKARAAPKAAALKRTSRPRARKVDAATSKPPVASLLAPSTTSRSGDIVPRSPAAGQDAWSVSPKWSAANGGNSAPYGTRALLNELGTNPAETTGYGAGAEVDLHF